MRKIIDKLFLPCFYGFCILGVAISIVNFVDMKQDQKKTLLEIEKSLNVTSTDQEIQLELKDEYKDKEIIYSSSNEEIVKVDENGNLKTVGEGTTIVTVTTKDGKHTQSFTVNVGEKAIEDYEKEQEEKESNKTDSNTSSTDSNSDKTPSANTDSNSDKKPSTNNSDNSTDNSSATSSNNNSSSNNSSTQSPSPSTTPTNKTVKVTSVTLNQESATISLNSNNKTLSLAATVAPSNATNKSLTWSSNNTNVATINNGVVTAKNPGVATITVTTKDGSKKDTITITITKRIVIVIGASQVTRMAKYKNSYSSANYNYNTSNGTLVYIHKSGSGIDYQTGDGLKTATATINSYSNVKAQTTFYIYFPLSGNTIKTFSCDEISKNNSSIQGYAKNYNDAIKNLKKAGYNINGYVVSMHPVKVSQAKSDTVVTNEHEKACTKKYRSNWKYYQFNRAIKSVIDSKYTTNLKYQSLFIRIMEVNNDQQNFSYKITYNTDDGVHWDAPTTNTYVDMMLNYSGDL